MQFAAFVIFAVLILSAEAHASPPSGFPWRVKCEWIASQWSATDGSETVEFPSQDVLFDAFWIDSLSAWQGQVNGQVVELSAVGAAPSDGFSFSPTLTFTSPDGQVQSQSSVVIAPVLANGAFVPDSATDGFSYDALRISDLDFGDTWYLPRIALQFFLGFGESFGWFVMASMVRHFWDAVSGGVKSVASLD